MHSAHLAVRLCESRPAVPEDRLASGRRNCGYVCAACKWCCNGRSLACTCEWIRPHSGARTVCGAWSDAHKSGAGGLDLAAIRSARKRTFPFRQHTFRNWIVSSPWYRNGIALGAVCWTDFGADSNRRRNSRADIAHVPSAAFVWARSRYFTCSRDSGRRTRLWISQALFGCGAMVAPGTWYSDMAAVAAVSFGLDRGILTRLSTVETSGFEQKLLSALRPMPAQSNTARHSTQHPHLPGFKGATAWLNSQPLQLDQLRGKVVLV